MKEYKTINEIAGPLVFVAFICRSEFLMRTRSASTSSNTATVIVDVWRRPFFSVGGTLCQRWQPASGSNIFLTDLPLALNAIYPDLSDRIS